MRPALQIVVTGVTLLALMASAGVAHARSLASVSDATSALAGARLWVNPLSPASRAATVLRRSRPVDAARLDDIAAQPTAVWFGQWNHDVAGDVRRIVAQAAADRAVPVLVAYNIPHRDCGEHSAGGERNAAGYRRWIREFARGLTGRAVVVLEPDAVALTRCLAPRQVEERFALLRDAVAVLKDARATVYIDAGNARWMPARDVAARLERAGVAAADGFALNVSNYIATPVNVEFGTEVSRLTGGKHFVIDTSRNGAGTATGHEWCNVPGQRLGERPTTRSGHRLVDAYLWIKQPGESDGPCEGGPRAGAFWPDYAIALTR